jgi:hypothetical protein
MQLAAMQTVVGRLGTCWRMPPVGLQVAVCRCRFQYANVLSVKNALAAEEYPSLGYKGEVKVKRGQETMTSCGYKVNGTA